MLLRKRLPENHARVVSLLETAHLPSDGLERTDGWVVEMDGAVVGHVAVETTRDAAVIRSLVVDPAFQGQGLGERLMAVAEEYAADRVLVLKTQTIGPWMERRGYRLGTLSEVPASVLSTTQFSGSLCSGTPLYFRPQGWSEHANHFSKENDMNKDMNVDTIKAAVRERYAGFVKTNSSCCAPASIACGCSGSFNEPSLKVGYATADVDAVPEGANLGLGCGNPVALVSLKPGEVVLDLGSGAGFDAFLASQRVGLAGRVIGVDMTPEMIARARMLAEKHGYTNVEFRQGDI